MGSEPVSALELALVSEPAPGLVPVSGRVAEPVEALELAQASRLVPSQWRNHLQAALAHDVSPWPVMCAIDVERLTWGAGYLEMRRFNEPFYACLAPSGTEGEAQERRNDKKHGSTRVAGCDAGT